MITRLDQNSNFEFEITNISPEPIGIFTLPKDKHMEYKKHITDIWENAPSELMQQFQHEPKTKHLCNLVNQNLFSSFKDLLDLKLDIQKIILSYIREIGFSCEEVIINSAWLNNAEKGSTLEYHTHSNSYVSGNYFVNFDLSKHTRLAFLNDRVCTADAYPNAQVISIPKRTDKKSIYTSNSYEIAAAEGKILIWRSNKAHGYKTPNQSGNRLTLSFNSMPKTLNNGFYSFDISE
tara:strand:+ start:667 stop:1371 length:705 start_codon:yes stop_codon:yes gene_type:complete